MEIHYFASRDFLCFILKCFVREAFYSDESYQNNHSKPFDKRQLKFNLTRYYVRNILESFLKEHPENYVKYCFNAKSCSQGQQKRKLYEKPESKKVSKHIVEFQIYLQIRTAPIHPNQRTKISFEVLYLYYCDVKFVSNIN